MSKREVVKQMYESTVAKQLEKLRGAAKSKMETAASTTTVTEADRVSQLGASIDIEPFLV